MENKEQVVERVKNGLDQLRRVLQEDGGDLEYVDMTNEGVVMLRLKGSCHGCPHATATVKQLIERSLKEAIPEVKAVYQVQ